MAFSVQHIRNDFPALQQKVHGKPLVYFDNAATTLKPKSVIETIARHYEFETANVHRGVHFLSEQATAKYEEARKKVARFLNAPHSSQILFTRGTTESINLVAQSFGRSFLKSGDEILISHMEHHSNIVPWQMLCQEKGCVLKVIPIDDRGQLRMDEFRRLLSPKTKLVSIVHVSNSLGTVNPVEEIIVEAKKVGARVLVDGAQSVSDTRIDVQAMGCDFFAFSGHKLFGPTGVGVLYGTKELLEQMPPIQGGGDMIASVTFEHTVYNVLPYKFEAGTPHIAGVIALGAAVDYFMNLDIAAVKAHKQSLLEYANRRLATIDGLQFIGTAARKTAVVSFVFKHIHPHDIGTLVDAEGVAIRTGHHCNQPIMQRFGVPATSRASLSIYNTQEEIDLLVAALQKVVKIFS